MRAPCAFSDRSVSPSFLRTTPAKNPRTECCCQPVHCMMLAIVAPLGRLSSPSTRACLECARAATLQRALFDRTLPTDRFFVLCARLLLDIAKTPSWCRRNSAPPPPRPRGGRSALAGDRSEPVRLRVRDHHACSVQGRSRVQNEAV